jgi:hypothetical protein
MIEVAIMGHGVVGSGVAEILIEHWDAIAQKAKNEINVKYILDLKDFSHLYYSDKFIKDFNIILRDPEIRVVVEVMGGINPAYDFVKKCLLAGKSVVTSNKELVAAKGAELIKIAKDADLVDKLKDLLDGDKKTKKKTTKKASTTKKATTKKTTTAKKTTTKKATGTTKKATTKKTTAKSDTKKTAAKKTTTAKKSTSSTKKTTTKKSTKK